MLRWWLGYVGIYPFLGIMWYTFMVMYVTELWSIKSNTQLRYSYPLPLESVRVKGSILCVVSPLSMRHARNTLIQKTQSWDERLSICLLAPLGRFLPSWRVYHQQDSHLSLLDLDPRPLSIGPTWVMQTTHGSKWDRKPGKFQRMEMQNKKVMLEFTAEGLKDKKG